ncbi:MAG: tetratricopeptide repeat protein [Nitrospinaceae bacterium]|nr:tetratricopeptide repeat protein [Nitrospinaceae bacterium]MBT3433965.1 tetratricopeptide repeat protein [Nitrospinaceae bacterium]MBT4092724.1 tetratricopeptide repeat protein [Nitrospinaceae bacterium]MBT5946380.1 tetratricopeptide repeat protein [Nitrospinaceae bacterium]MBT6394447.1 tetratricopeptide repeat protein [Nitrospinaceae bacterium]
MPGKSRKKKPRKSNRARGTRKNKTASPSIKSLENSAIALHQGGRLPEAEKLYRQILTLDENHALALNHLGIILQIDEKHEESLAFFNRSVEMAPASHDFRFNRGRLFVEMGRNEEAAGDYRAAIELSPQFTAPLINLGILEMGAGNTTQAKALYLKAIEIQPDMIEAHLNLGTLFLGEGNAQEARQSFDTVLRLDPGNQPARHLLSTLAGDSPETAPKEFVSKLFDDYAGSFETHLTEELGYQFPQMIREAVPLVLNREPVSLRILDLGCGTGLCGLLFRDMAETLIGVDLSPGMLAKAREKNVYDSLIEGDLSKALEAESESLDLVIAADVFIYVGNLRQVFSGCRGAMSAGALLAFSTEYLDGEGFELRASGRFAHSTKYIEALADEFGFSVVKREEIAIRTSNAQPLAGNLYIVSKQDSVAAGATNAEAVNNLGEPKNFDDALNKVFQEILEERYSVAASGRGWLFTTVLDHAFIDGDLESMPAVKVKTGEYEKPVAEDIDVIKEASVFLARIGDCEDTKKKYEMMEEMAMMNVPVLTSDSFVNSADSDLYRDVEGIFEGDCLNVVIVGAGLSGLALASALKMTLRGKVNVLVVENRIYAQHHKLPYRRRWITNVPLELGDGLLEDEIIALMAAVGKKSYIGVTVNVFETLMLLSCRRMGVKFLFSDNCDFSFLENSKAQVVFNATGNRFRKISFPEVGAPAIAKEVVPTNVLHMPNEGISDFGVKIDWPKTAQEITVEYHGNIFIPVLNGRRIKSPIVKVGHIPFRLYQGILNLVAGNNADNKIYVWPGTLKAEINQVIVIIGLQSNEYENLYREISSPEKIGTVLQNRLLLEVFDERVVRLLEFISDRTDAADDVVMEPPFVYEPYLIKYPGGFEKLHGKPVIPIGDSIYNGNMKMGNGISPHLGHVKDIKNLFVKHMFS